jgi:hypothetical protein
MRVIEKKVIGAFLNGQKLTISNTSTNGRSLFLHGHEIARFSAKNGLELNFCGWVTPTTQSRLNSLCELVLDRRPLSIKQGTPRSVVNGFEVPACEFFPLETLTKQNT